MISSSVWTASNTLLDYQGAWAPTEGYSAAMLLEISQDGAWLCRTCSGRLPLAYAHRRRVGAGIHGDPGSEVDSEGLDAANCSSIDLAIVVRHDAILVDHTGTLAIAGCLR